MQRSTDRILTTHVGSLPRPPEVVELLRRRDRDEAIDAAEFERVIGRAVNDVVARQVAVGIDVVNDGEASKASYATYIQQRLTGFGEVDKSRWPVEKSPDRAEFPEYYARPAVTAGPATRRMLACTGPIAVRDRAPLDRDIARLKAAVAASKPSAAFMSAASPGVVSRFHPNFHYATSADYRAAIGAAMREEYEAIVNAGLVLQLDCPDLASGWMSVFATLGEDQFVRECHVSIEILNDALRNVPADKVRLHLCWGNYEGPHVHDIALEKILPAVLKAKAQVISFEGANPRHAHEWEVWRRIKLPDDKVLMPGVLDTTSNFVEHPELVAQRLCAYADGVGRERVIAGVDCGFETFAGVARVDTKIVYKKLEAMVEGARIATKKLWGRA
ncbi:MAG TPA: cobalamin-independent methionine synthase II family protein [Stellaceae bacterium]|jgi:5-methyltetrahydropteroyltriglutamate--homocysteine methyltransferase|nr:cobalamin-independent methionine synthase II family protein [Stellaceae bacterium]